MDKFKMVIETIRKQLNSNMDTLVPDWKIVFETLTGKNDAETLKNVQKFILENFSFEIQDKAEGTVYYGSIGATKDTINAPVFMIVGEIVKGAPNSYGYISATQAGKLFNEESFKTVLKDSLDSELQEYYENVLFNGIYDNIEEDVKKAVLDNFDRDQMMELKNQGKLLVDGEEIQALNDFFSENYIKNIKTANLNTLMSGTYPVNCWGRTEFFAVMKNDNIKTINGIEKEVFRDLHQRIFELTQDEKTAMDYTTEVIRAAQTEFIPDKWVQITEGVDDKGQKRVDTLSFAPKDTQGAVPLIDTMLCNNNMPSATKLKEIVTQYGHVLMPETRKLIENLAWENEAAVYERLVSNGKAIAELSKDGNAILPVNPFELTKDGRVLKNGMDVTYNKEAALAKTSLSPIGYGLSVEQQALINTFLYYDGIFFKEGRTLGENINNMKRNQPEEWKKMLSKCPGFCREKDAELVVEAILKDPMLRDLKVVDCTYNKEFGQGSINVCLLSEKSKEIFFSFRGNNGLEWMDIAKRFMGEPGKQQQAAAKYVEDILARNKFIEKGYAIDVMGHSTGGNKAQYVTLENPHIRKCDSHDGMGFPLKIFWEKKQEIAERAGKIISHAADVDYVHCLGYTIAEKQMWYESKLPKNPFLQPPRWAWAHSPGAYMHFDENGVLSMNKMAPQSDFAQAIHKTTQKMMEAPEKLQEVYFNAIMSAAQLAKTRKPLQDERVSGEINKDAQRLVKDLKETLSFTQKLGFKDKWLSVTGKLWFGEEAFHTLMAEKKQRENDVNNAETAKENVKNKIRRKTNIGR